MGASPKTPPGSVRIDYTSTFLVPRGITKIKITGSGGGGGGGGTGVGSQDGADGGTVTVTKEGSVLFSAAGGKGGGNGDNAYNVNGGAGGAGGAGAGGGGGAGYGKSDYILDEGAGRDGLSNMYGQIGIGGDGGYSILNYGGGGGGGGAVGGAGRGAPAYVGSGGTQSQGGKGAGGSTAGGGGGGGGGYLNTVNNIAVTPGETLNVDIPIPAQPGFDGTSPWAGIFGHRGGQGASGYVEISWE